jgi:hypothetical protein
VKPMDERLVPVFGFGFDAYPHFSRAPVWRSLFPRGQAPACGEQPMSSSDGDESVVPLTHQGAALAGIVDVTA